MAAPFNLTYEISNDMFKYPSDSEPNIVTIPSSIEVVDGVTRYRSGRQVINMTNHHGTHIDAPCHKIPGGKTIDSYPISKFRNKAFLINLKNFKNGQNYFKVIEEEHILKKIPKEHADDLVDHDIHALIFYTGFCDEIMRNEGRLSGQEKTEFEKTFPYFSQGAAQYLAENFPFLNIIGIDSFAVDPPGSNSEVHRIFFAKDILPLETLVGLAELESQVGYGSCCFSYPPSRIFDLHSAPLIIKGGDAAQVRAYAEIP